MKLFTVREEAIKNIEVTRTEGPLDLLGVPFGQGPLRWATEYPIGEILALTVADVVPDGEGLRLISEQSPGDQRALVIVETASGVGGKVRLAANLQEEDFDKKKGRVFRRNLPLENAAGVKVFAEVEDHFLVEMQPGASFRIMWNGNLAGAPPELIVMWHGRWKGWQLSALQQRMALTARTGEGTWPTPAEILAPWAFEVRARHARHGEV